MGNFLKDLLSASTPDSLTPANVIPAHGEMAGIKTAQLRWLVLGPAMAIVLIMTGILIASAYYLEDNATPDSMSLQAFDTQDMIHLALVMGIACGSLLFAFLWLLTSRIGRLIEQHQSAIQHLATRDGLTGLFNHITFYIMLEDEVARSQRTAAPVSLLILDLDHFKRINAAFGRIAGDTALKEFGRVIHREARSIDKVCRYGGEELAVVLPETDTAGAMLAAERMRSSIAEHLFKIDEGPDQTITISIGVAVFPEHAPTAQKLVDAADRALNIAKERGRNQVCKYSS
jgi:diguanylate cyclase (GGDEF)-like protein